MKTHVNRTDIFVLRRNILKSVDEGIYSVNQITDNEFGLIRGLDREQQHGMDIAHTISVDREYIYMAAGPIGVDVNLGNGEPLFEEGQDSVLRASKLSLFIDRHFSIPRSGVVFL
jgi:hypothetical protein